MLGGTYDLPHATTHAVVLPHVLALNGPAVPDAAARLADALGTTATTEPADGPEAAVRALDALRADVRAPTALRDHGLAERDLADATDRCLAVVPPSNPVPVSRDAMTRLLRAAWAGTPSSHAGDGSRHPPLDVATVAVLYSIIQLIKARIE